MAPAAAQGAGHRRRQAQGKAKELTPRKSAPGGRRIQGADRSQVTLLAVGAALVLGVGLIAPASLHAAFHRLRAGRLRRVPGDLERGAFSLHTPLMAVTNAISSIIILGALMQIGSTSVLITMLAASPSSWRRSTSSAASW
jgi:H+-translocating NAD(P) transhydrogenase subunit alpha